MVPHALTEFTQTVEPPGIAAGNVTTQVVPLGERTAPEMLQLQPYEAAPGTAAMLYVEFPFGQTDVGPVIVPGCGATPLIVMQRSDEL